MAEVWETEEAQQKFNQRLQALLAEVGAPPRPEPQKYVVHNLVIPQVATTRG